MNHRSAWQHICKHNKHIESIGVRLTIKTRKVIKHREIIAEGLSPVFFTLPLDQLVAVGNSVNSDSDHPSEPRLQSNEGTGFSGHGCLVHILPETTANSNKQ